MSFGYCITSEPTEANYGAYGAELVKVYLSICSEIDVAFKDLNHLVRRYESADWGTVNNISGARKMVHARFSQQFRFSWVAIGTSGIVVNPWSSWWADDGTESAMNPEWWVSYNKVKHHRLDSYAEANLWNVLQALSGLFILISCLYRYEYEHNAEEALAICRPLSDWRFRVEGSKSARASRPTLSVHLSVFLRAFTLISRCGCLYQARAMLVMIANKV